MVVVRDVDTVVMPQRFKHRFTYVSRQARPVTDTPQTLNECASQRSCVHGGLVTLGLVLVVLKLQRM